MARQRSVFDIIGPVMIGPSSSHTAGAVRLGKLARAVFGDRIESAEIALHGSFASTGHGHGTDLALIAGLLGMEPDDTRIPQVKVLAEEAGVAVSFLATDLGEVHPNTAEFQLVGQDGKRMRVRGSSLGGGDVIVTDVDGFEVEMTGELPVLVVEHPDRPGEIAAVTHILADYRVNVASMQVSRERRGARAIMLIETDEEAGAEAVSRIRELPGIGVVRTVAAI